MFEPKVTVLMSVYNGEKHLKEAIDSILTQTFTDFEFLIINDGSTDKTGETLRSYNDPRIRIIENLQNIGLTKSLNKGLTLAKGEYIARQDADDISLQERLATQVNFLDNHPEIGLVGSWYIIIDRNGEELLKCTLPVENAEVRKRIMEFNPFAHGSVMLRKKCIEEVGPYDEKFSCAQDYELWFRILDRHQAANISAYLYKWRFNQDSIVARRYAEQMKFICQAKELTKKRSKGIICSDNFATKNFLYYVIEGRKNLAGLYYNCGEYLYGKGKIRKSRQFLLKSIKLNPGNFKSLKLFFRCFLKHT